MTQVPKKRRWLRFSVRGLLVMTLFAAFGVWWMMLPAVVYHEFVYEPFPKEGFSITVGLNAPTKTYIAKDVESTNPSQITYWDESGNGKIDNRSEIRRRMSNPLNSKILVFETIHSVDVDHDGNFGEERHLLTPDREWTRKIHILVPKTTP